MTFRVPALASYLIGLVFIALIAAAGYLAGLGTESVKVLAIGLFIGQLIGSCIGPRTAAAGSTPKAAKAAAPAAPRAEGGSIALYVGNIAFNANRSALQKLFETCGEVKSVRIMTDRQTRKPRGYGFVEMDEAGARAAITSLDGKEFCGRALRVSEAQQKDDAR